MKLTWGKLTCLVGHGLSDCIHVNFLETLAHILPADPKAYTIGIRVVSFDKSGTFLKIQFTHKFELLIH